MSIPRQIHLPIWCKRYVYHCNHSSPLLLHLPLPVSWPDQRHSQARRSAAGFCYIAHSTLRCNLNVSLLIKRKSRISLYCPDERYSGQNPFGNLTFINHFKEVFSQTSISILVHDPLYRVRQERYNMADYILLFRTLAATSGWNETAVITAYHHGLNSSIRQQMAIYNNIIGIENFIQHSIRLPACTLDQPALHPPSTSPSVNPPAPEPMQVDSFHLSNVERQWRIANRLCLYCGAVGHLLPSCPVHPPHPAASTIQLPLSIPPLTRTDVILFARLCSVPSKALIDSGSVGHFISLDLLGKQKAAGPWYYPTLHPHRDAPHRSSASRKDFVHGAGGFHI